MPEPGDKIEIKEYDNCPGCGSSFIGNPIPEESIANYNPLDADPNNYPNTHFRRVIGIEIKGQRDGVLHWKCPDCGFRWHRFTGLVLEKGKKLSKQKGFTLAELLVCLAIVLCLILVLVFSMKGCPGSTNNLSFKAGTKVMVDGVPGTIMGHERIDTDGNYTMDTWVYKIRVIDREGEPETIQAFESEVTLAPER